jgi:hypothetical protein
MKTEGEPQGLQPMIAFLERRIGAVGLSDDDLITGRAHGMHADILYLTALRLLERVQRAEGDTEGLSPQLSVFFLLDRAAVFVDRAYRQSNLIPVVIMRVRVRRVLAQVARSLAVLQRACTPGQGGN